MTCWFFAVSNQSVATTAAVVAVQIVTVPTAPWRSTMTALTAPFRRVPGSFNWTLARWLRFRDGLGLFFAYTNGYAELRCKLVGGRKDSRYEQLDTFPETIEHDLAYAVCEQPQTDIRGIIVYMCGRRLTINSHNGDGKEIVQITILA